MATAFQTARSAARIASRRVPFPRAWGLRASDAYALFLGNAVLIVAMWIRHGNLSELATTGGTLTAIGELTALLGTYFSLVQLILVSRSPYFDEVFGTDRLLWMHKWLGFTTVWLLGAHVVFTTVGYGLTDGSGPVAEFVNFLLTYPYVLWAAVSGLLFGAVGFTSMQARRKATSYETWYGIHLYAYLAIALGFMHQLAVGQDFVTDPVARIYWIALYVVALGSVLVFRVGAPIAANLHHRFYVANVVEEAPGIVSIYVGGRDLDRLPVRAGQWFRLRLLTGNSWWRSHPYSISAAPNGEYLRFTVKALGDGSGALQTARIGTRVFAEGPYGILTGARRSKRRVLLVAGGIGITPLRALPEELPARSGDVTLLYRAHRADDLAFRRELDVLARMRGATVHYLVGRRGSREMPRDPLKADALAALVPDVAARDVYICGPDAMMATTRRSLRRLGVPESQIHFESFAF